MRAAAAASRLGSNVSQECSGTDVAHGAFEQLAVREVCFLLPGCSKDPHHISGESLGPESVLAHDGRVARLVEIG
jgi:hypothetical protein